MTKKPKHPPIYSYDYLLHGNARDRICIYQLRSIGWWAVEGHGDAIEFIDFKRVPTFEEAWEIAEAAAAQYRSFKILQGLR